jgi:hypothetical protein
MKCIFFFSRLYILRHTIDLGGYNRATLFRKEVLRQLQHFIAETPRNCDIAGRTIARRQSRGDSRVLEHRGKFISQRNMIVRRVLRDRGTPRNTVGTYEYNPVNEEQGGGEEGRL